MNRRVVITGIGVVAPSGTGKDEFWANTVSGAVCIDRITRFDAGRYPVSVAGEVKAFSPTDYFPLRLLRKTDRFTQFALVATELAIRDAGFKLKDEDPDRVGIMIGNCLGGWEFAETELRELYVHGVKEVSPYQATAWFPAAPQGQISIFYGLKGYSKTVVADRAGGTVALGYAARTIMNGQADVIFAGGAEAPITPYAFLCCNTYGLLSNGNGGNPSAAYRPFDRNRNGLVIGEGAGMLILEELEHARKRNAVIYGEIIGYGMTCDGHHHSKCGPNGKQFSRAMRLSLERGGAKPEEVDYICADGVATLVGDKIETEAVKEVFGSHAYRLAVSAPKSMIGNLYGAAGAVDLITTLLAMNHDIAPPTVNYETPDPACDLDYVPNRPQKRRIKTALVNSRGQGGINATLLVRKV